jgi:predicted RNase H-like HicB family nuclease
VTEITNIYGHRLKVELDRELDGRWIADIPEIPGAMSYGDSKLDAIFQAEGIARIVLACRMYM